MVIDVVFVSDCISSTHHLPPVVLLTLTMAVPMVPRYSAPGMPQMWSATTCACLHRLWYNCGGEEGCHYLVAYGRQASRAVRASHSL